MALIVMLTDVYLASAAEVIISEIAEKAADSG
jgi:hypothetical protein